MSELFPKSAAKTASKTASKAEPRPAANDYTAKDIEVLEGLEPVRRRPGMYIGGTDSRALHHLVTEVLDNAMDEAVAGHANRIELHLAAGNLVRISDNGRGFPTDPHPKFPKLSAVEVILTTLHSGGKFGGSSYKTSGGLHGVGISVVNALSDHLTIEVFRDKKGWRQDYSRGNPLTPLNEIAAVAGRRGTMVEFTPDLSIFGAEASFSPTTLYRMARSRAYLFKGVELRWTIDPNIPRDAAIPESETIRFPGGLADYLQSLSGDQAFLIPTPFVGEASFSEDAGRMEWAITWPQDEDTEAVLYSYCNTIPTPQGGTHEAGMRNALTRSLRAHGERVNNRRAALITTEDVMGGAMALLSIFIREPQFQGQTKEKLTSVEAQKLVETTLKDHFDHFLSGNPTAANGLLEALILRAEERINRREKKELRKTATRRLRLPGKLADCSRNTALGSEIFLVEGDSAGGSAKQARNRENQAILPLRGKILNVASASLEKLKGNAELADLVLALGAGSGGAFDAQKLRYEKVIIMTDADVDGAHIASLLMTFFYREMRPLIEQGHLFLAQPPLYRLASGGKSIYAQDDAERDRLLATEFKGKKIEVSRFKGLGEMPAMQLRETTMNPARRSLLRVVLADDSADQSLGRRDHHTAKLVEELMGKKPELRFAFIQENAKFVKDLDL
ncbi:MAG: DNA topoisomerase IV subunit B [Candidatus Pacebacteria bacterium]|nr:DNA topoisomerase IV subunit B [Candidatus Paceibacterota bacterium]